MVTNTLKRNMIVAGAAATIALSPLAAKNAFAAKEPVAENPVAAAVADSQAANKRSERLPPWVPLAVTGVVIGGMILLVGRDPPQREEKHRFSSNEY